MKKFLKWTGIIILSLVLIIALTSWILANKFEREFDKVYDVKPAPVTIPTDSASVERGRVLTVGCRTCHDVDLAGKVFFDDPTIGQLPSSNLTRSKHSQTESYTDEDFVLALRHGVNKDGHALMIMPSEAYTHFSDQDLGCIIAYIKSLPPIERNFPMRKFKYTAKVMAGAGLFGNLFPYKIIDHEVAKNVTAPPIGATVEYGEYVMNFDGCRICHAANLGGMKTADPASPLAPNISTSGVSGKWTLEQFIATFRTGKTPEGKALNGQFMPFAGVGALSDVEIEALYKYIHSLPPAAIIAEK